MKGLFDICYYNFRVSKICHYNLRIRKYAVTISSFLSFGMYLMPLDPFAGTEILVWSRIPL
jgi:hypothetical protein